MTNHVELVRHRHSLLASFFLHVQTHRPSHRIIPIILSSKIVRVLVLLLHCDQLVVKAQIHVVSEFPAYKCLKILAEVIKKAVMKKVKFKQSKKTFVR